MSFVVDGAACGSQVANVPRPPAFCNKTGAPNVEHGFAWVAPAQVAEDLAQGSHVVRVMVTAPDGTVDEAHNSPACVTDKKPSRCTLAD